MLIRKYSKECTELEDRLSDHFRDSGTEPDWAQCSVTEHSLDEFVRAYEHARVEPAHPYEDDNQIELMDEFLRIAKADIAGSFEYNVADCEKVIKALETFGL